MSYESVVLHGGDYGAVAVVLPVPRLRTIYTASDHRERGNIRGSIRRRFIYSLIRSTKIIGIAARR